MTDLIESLNPRTRSVAIAMALIIALGILILTPIPQAQAVSVQASGMPDRLSLDEEATISVVVDPEEEEYVQMVDVEMVVSHPSKGIIASGSFYPNGTIMD
ncbi:MAG: hypothetical protein LUQ27_02345, partial [Methanomassiliicoccales archaeon]|nr:hypothetical protein [Methanomassiliicoccales archaeon]